MLQTSYIFKLRTRNFLIYIAAIVLITIGCDSNKITYPKQLDQLHENVISYYTKQAVDQKKIDKLLEKEDEYGAWPTIDYTSKQRGGWPVREHLANVQYLAIAYNQKGSGYYKSKDVSEKIHLSLNYWLDNDFLSTNWWDQHIGVPELLAPIVFLMEDELSDEQIQQALPLLRRAEIKMTGQNKVWLSGNVLLRSLLLRDVDSIAMASNSIQEELNVTNGEGIQYDWSYHQHGAQLQFGNYGMSYLEDMIKWYKILDNTPFSYQGNKAAILRNYALHGQQWVSWKGKYDISASGRKIFPNEPSRITARFETILKELAEIDQAHSEAYQRALDYKNLVGNKHFWKSDFHVQRTKNYYFSLKMASNRVLGAETVNKENVQGYHMGDGVTFLYQSGDEYDNVFPFWDWKKLPGTTLIQDTTDLSQLTAWGYHIESDFVGGVSDSISGISVLQYNRDGLLANKSWFMFDDMVVCLGSGIRTESNFPVVTTMSQSFLKGDVLVEGNGKSQTIKRLNSKEDYDWILHDHIGYLFPKGGQLKLQTKILEGSWNKVAKRYRPIILTDHVFKLWFDHGTSPQNGSYEYVLIPNASGADMEELNINPPFQVINLENVQSVQSSDGKISGAVFYTKGKASILDGVETSAACVLMIKKQNGGITLSISDPTQKLQNINVLLNGIYIGEYATTSTNQTKLNLPLPHGANAGKTITLKYKKDD